MNPKISVYIPCRDYGRFLTTAVESVVRQSLEAWELILVDDGSQDETKQIIHQYATIHPEKIRAIFNPSPRGLAACANQALEGARGEYLIRLDADDYLDENALLIMTSYLDRHPDIALVYPNYVYIDVNGQFLGIENRKKANEEAKLMDLPAHGACTMVRKSVLKSVGGYSENYDCQDGYELWLKVLNRYPVASVETPLFYYRQHPESISRNEKKILTARQGIKSDIAGLDKGKVKPKIVAIIPAKNTYSHLPNIALQELAGRPLIDYTLEAARQVELFDKVFVTSDDPRVVEHCQTFDGVVSMTRPLELSGRHTALIPVLRDAVHRLEQQHAIFPDILVVLNIHSPLRQPEHIREAVETLLLYNTDSVISVYEDYDLHFVHGSLGLEPLNQGMLEKLRLEREALYVDNGAIKVIWKHVLDKTNLYGRKVGHIVMPKEQSHQILSADDLWLISQILEQQKEASILQPQKCRKLKT